jgi:hypothetical protein
MKIVNIKSPLFRKTNEFPSRFLDLFDNKYITLEMEFKISKKDADKMCEYKKVIGLVVE